MSASRPLRWSAIQQVGAQFIALLGTIVLGSLLAPSQWGVFAIAQAVVAFGMSFVEMGLSAALIQRAELEERHRSTCFVSILVTGVVLAAICWVAAPVVQGVFGVTGLSPVQSVLAVTILLMALGSVPRALAQREKRFKDLAIRDSLAGVIGVFAAVGAAQAGLGTWSLVVQQVVTIGIGSLTIFKLSSWRPNLREARVSTLKELLPFAGRVTLSNGLKYVAQNVDRLLIGFYLGETAAGLYAFAMRLILQPISGLRTAVGNYLFSHLSGLQTSPDKSEQEYLRSSKLLLGLAPAVLAMAPLVAAILPMVGWAKWSEAAPLFLPLALVCVLQLVMTPFGEYIKSMGRADLLLHWSLAISVLSVAGVAVGVLFGIRGAAWGMAIAYIVSFPFMVLLQRASGAKATRLYALQVLLAALQSVVSLLAVILLIQFLRLELALALGLAIIGAWPLLALAKARTHPSIA